MANLEPLAPMVLVRYTPNFEQIDYGLHIGTAFDLTTPIQAIQLEAGVKMMGVMIQVALVDPETIFGPPPVETEESKDEPER